MINNEQKRSIGFDFIMENLYCNTPYGSEKKKNLMPYKLAEKSFLINELENVKKVVENIDQLKDEFDLLEHTFMQFKEIRTSIKKMNGSVLDEIELFEVKNFLLLLQKVIISYIEINKHANFIDIEFLEMEEVLNLLDPEKKRISSFYISDMYSEELKEIRIERKEIESKILNKRVLEDSAELKKRRLEIVCKEEEIELEIKTMLTKKMQPFMDIFYKNIENIGKLDLTIQKGKLAINLGAIYPKISETEVKFKNVFNPYMQELLKKRKKQFKKVNINLQKQTTFLTGYG